MGQESGSTKEMLIEAAGRAVCGRGPRGHQYPHNSGEMPGKYRCGELTTSGARKTCISR